MLRGTIRFQANPMDYARLDFNPQGEFAPSTVGLIINESYSGTAVVICGTHTFKTDKVISIQVGHIGPLKAKLVWFKELDDQIHKIGIQYLE